MKKGGKKDQKKGLSTEGKKFSIFCELFFCVMKQ